MNSVFFFVFVGIIATAKDCSASPVAQPGLNLGKFLVDTLQGVGIIPPDNKAVIKHKKDAKSNLVIYYENFFRRIFDEAKNKCALGDLSQKRISHLQDECAALVKTIDETKAFSQALIAQLKRIRVACKEAENEIKKEKSKDKSCIKVRNDIIADLLELDTVSNIQIKQLIDNVKTAIADNKPLLR